MVDKTLPFQKWVGGKRQLLPGLCEPAFRHGYGNTYSNLSSAVAVLFHLAGMYSFDNIIINDANVHLINLYRAVQTDVDALCTKLDVLPEHAAADGEAERDVLQETSNITPTCPG